MIERAIAEWPVVMFGLVVAALFFYATHRGRASIAVRGYVRRVAVSRWEYGIASVKDSKSYRALGHRSSAKAALSAVDGVLRPSRDRRETS